MPSWRAGWDTEDELWLTPSSAHKSHGECRRSTSTCVRAAGFPPDKPFRSVCCAFCYQTTTSPIASGPPLQGLLRASGIKDFNIRSFTRRYSQQEYPETWAQVLESVQRSEGTIITNAGSASHLRQAPFVNTLTLLHSLTHLLPQYT